MNELIIEQKVREMILYGYTALRQLPRAERHVLSAEIRSAMLRLLKLVITAAKRHHKKTTLTDMDVELAAGAISLSECRPAIESWIAHASHANTYSLRKSLFSEPMIKGATK